MSFASLPYQGGPIWVSKWIPPANACQTPDGSGPVTTECDSGYWEYVQIIDDLTVADELPNLLDTTGLFAYPKFKEIVTNMPRFLTMFPNIVTALSVYTGFSESKIKALMQPGKGPHIQVVPNLTSTYGDPLYGCYDAETKTLKISENYVNSLSSASNEKAIRATGLLLAITTLHEFVHYGRDANHLKDLYTDPSTGMLDEAGASFEMNIIPDGTVINKNNAIRWIKFYPFNF